MFSLHPCQGQSAALLTSMAQHSGHGSGLRTDLWSECTLHGSLESGGHLSSEQAGHGVGTLKGTSVQCLFLRR